MPVEDTPQDGLDDRFVASIKHSINEGELLDPGGKARMVGQCGDSIGVHIAVDNAVLSAVRVQPEGCAYTRVCAGAMSFLAQGLSVDEALRLDPQDIVAEVGGLPEDHMHCARLALNALGEAVADYYARLVGNGLKEEG